MPRGYGRCNRYRWWANMIGMPGWWLRYSYYQPQQQIPLQRLRDIPYEEYPMHDEYNTEADRPLMTTPPVWQMYSDKHAQQPIFPAVGYNYNTMPHSQVYTHFQMRIEDEIAMLEEEKHILEDQLDDIKMRIDELKKYMDDETIVQIYNLLPKFNCGRCGFPTCLDCAKSIAEGNATAYACVVVGKAIKPQVDAILSSKKKRR